MIQTISHLAKGLPPFCSLNHSGFSAIRLYRIKLVNLIVILQGAGINNEYRLLPW